MRKIIALIVLVYVVSIFGYSKKNFFIDITANFLTPADDGYAKTFGDNLFYPEVKAGIKIFKAIYLYVGYGTLNQNTFIGDIGDGPKVISAQTFISFGLEYELLLTKSIFLKASSGIGLVFYKEKSYLLDLLMSDVSGNNFGYKLDIGLSYNFFKNFNMGIIAGYFYAHNVEDFYRKLKLGGAKVGIVLGIRF